MELHQLIKPMGILTYSLVILTIFSGIRRWNIKKHMIMGMITAVLATIHAVLVLLD